MHNDVYFRVCDTWEIINSYIYQPCQWHVLNTVVFLCLFLSPIILISPFVLLIFEADTQMHFITDGF